MAGRNFLQHATLIKVADHAIAATDPVESAVVDASGSRSVVFFTSFGTANAGNLLKVQQDDVNAAGGMSDLLGSGVSSGSSDEDVIVEVVQPAKRYLRAVAVRGLYGAEASALAGNSVSGTQVAELHLTPGEGTA